MDVSYYGMVEAWPGLTPTPDPDSWKLLSPASWQDETLKVDASVVNEFSWQGSFLLEGIPSSETILFSVVDESSGQVVYPVYPAGTPEEERLPMELSPTVTSVTIVAGAIPAGTRGVARIEVVRDLPFFDEGRDQSRRSFEGVVDFLDLPDLPSDEELFADMPVGGIFRFNAAAGVSYKIESSSNLEDWDLEESGIIGSGGTVIRCYPTESVPGRFFRASRE